LNDLPLADLRAANDRIDDGVFVVLGARNAMQALGSYGSGSSMQVRERLGEWQARLGMG
jgi:hypothetical protein